MNNSTRFCIKSDKKNETREALESLLDIDGDMLFLGYGYIGASGAPVDYLEKVIKWLKKSEENSINIYVGIIPDPYISRNDGITNAVKKVKSDFAKLFTRDLYETRVTGRIFVYASLGMHCKFALCCKSQGKNHPIPLSGVFGSSNLTTSALTMQNRFELDLFVGSNDPLLKDLSSAIFEIIDDIEMLENSLEKEIKESIWNIGEDIRERIYYTPAYDEAKQELVEEAKQEFVEEAKARASYMYDGIGHKERKALIESDLEQGISSWNSTIDR